MHFILEKNLRTDLTLNQPVMKNLSYLFFTYILLICLLQGCSKAVFERTDGIDPLSPANNDLDAGTWKTVLLEDLSEIVIPIPAATNSPDYIAQINEIKSWQKELTGEERDLVKYWSAGAVLRWNEILRELVAKHNIPPYENADGTYPVPNAANPLAYPYFPFSNPPYAARAYAYISAAQYDALVAAWHYKGIYNRPAPYKVDETLQVLSSKSDLPSYPSEDAVVAGVAVEIMKLMFPGDQDFIQRKAEEHKKSRLLAGANVRSDIEAGEALGKAVAQKFVARARTDRAGVAGGNPQVWAKMEQDCIIKGEGPWKSMEIPMRPPMLPLFGKVKSFLFDSLTLVTQIRPGPPPSTSSELFKKETEEVLWYTQHPTRERMAIVTFWADGVGTSTPPGHWNSIAADDFIKKDFSEVRWARNFALLNMAMMDAAIACWDAKFTYYNPRPSQVDPRIKTLTGLPNFPSYVSGHSVFSAAAAAVLGHINPARSSAYEKMAEEAMLSRLYGGIHFRADCEVGYATGLKVASYAIDRAMTDGAE